MEFKLQDPKSFFGTWNHCTGDKDKQDNPMYYIALPEHVNKLLTQSESEYEELKQIVAKHSRNQFYKTITEIYMFAEGQREELPLYFFGKIKDGFFVCISALFDSTGFECQCRINIQGSRNVELVYNQGLDQKMRTLVQELNPHLPSTKLQEETKDQGEKEPEYSTEKDTIPKTDSGLQCLKYLSCNSVFIDSWKNCYTGYSEKADVMKYIGRPSNLEPILGQDDNEYKELQEWFKTHHGFRFYDEIDHVYMYKTGENDEEFWYLFSRLKNGFYVCIWAACDLTGFDCKSDVTIQASRDFTVVYNRGLTNVMRSLVCSINGVTSTPLNNKYIDDVSAHKHYHGFDDGDYD